MAKSITTTTNDKLLYSDIGEYVKECAESGVGFSTIEMVRFIQRKGWRFFKTSLPPTTGEPLLHVDMTPDDDLPLRVLRTYRENCDYKWADSTVPGAEPTNKLLLTMNEDNDKRAKLFDIAISILEKNKGEQIC